MKSSANLFLVTQSMPIFDLTYSAFLCFFHDHNCGVAGSVYFSKGRYKELILFSNAQTNF